MIKNVVLALIFLSITTHAKSLSVGWELWYPYQYHNSQQQLTGLDFDVVNAVNKQLNFDIEFVELPWKRHLQYISSGEIQIAMGSSFTPERDKFAYFTIPYRVEKINLFVLKGMKDKIKLSALADLATSNYMIGVEGGYYYGERYQQLMTKIEFQSHINEVIDLEQNVALLLKGHIDGLLADPVTLKAFAEKYKLQKEFDLHDLEIYQTDIHFMLSKKSMSADDLEQFNQAISTLISSGELSKIIDRWSSLKIN